MHLVLRDVGWWILPHACCILLYEIILFLFGWSQLLWMKYLMWRRSALILLSLNSHRETIQMGGGYHIETEERSSQVIIFRQNHWYWFEMMVRSSSKCEIDTGFGCINLGNRTRVSIWTRHALRIPDDLWWKSAHDGYFLPEVRSFYSDDTRDSTAN